MSGDPSPHGQWLLDRELGLILQFSHMKRKAFGISGCKEQIRVIQSFKDLVSAVMFQVLPAGFGRSEDGWTMQPRGVGLWGF